MLLNTEVFRSQKASSEDTVQNESSLMKTDEYQQTKESENRSESNEPRDSGPHKSSIAYTRHQRMKIRSGEQKYVIRK